MTRTASLRRSAAAAAAATLLVAGVAPLASAKDLEVRASGTCASGTTWKLKAKADDGRIETELEVDSNRVGQVWAWTLYDNGVRLAYGSATTVAPSGSFEVERRITNRAGTDTITATATRGSTTCRARVVYPA